MSPDDAIGGGFHGHGGSAEPLPDLESSTAFWLERMLRQRELGGEPLLEWGIPEHYDRMQRAREWLRAHRRKQD